MWIFLLIIMLINKFTIISTTCQNAIYCTGQLLHTIQMANLFEDSKIFVDMHLIYDIEKTIVDFNEFMVITNNQPSDDEIRVFVERHFEAENLELELWKPPDYQANPRFLRKIANSTMRAFAKELVELWWKLGRRIKFEVIENPTQFSIIPVPHGFIVPGGRFREFYYWDSYWIIKGLLICDMPSTVKGMLENFFYLVENYGFIPNGGRIYYLDRSQPPLLTLMVDEFMKRTNDKSWLRKNIVYLDKELQFWVEKKSRKVLKDGQFYLMAYYQSFSHEPRPESYIEDVHSAAVYRTLKEKHRCYRAIRSGAESGWDFSTRWLIYDEHSDNRYNLSKIDPTRIIPVELNAILARSFRILSGFYSTLRNKKRAAYWLHVTEHFELAIHNVLYSPKEGVWFDYDFKLGQKRKFFYPTNLAPLWTRSFNTTDHRIHCKRAAQYMITNSIFDYDGGVPTSLQESGEQWDLPNAWAPLQSIIIFAFEQCEDLDSKRFARHLAKKWLMTNFETFEKSNEMFEKYNVLLSGVQGSGGEYKVQTGFGWTNGVILELIEHYYVRKKIML